MSLRKVNLPKMIRGAELEVRAGFVPSSLDEKARTVELVFSEGTRGLRSNWFGEKWYEELSLQAEHVRLQRANNGAPLLDTHSRYSLRDVIGVIERAWIDTENGKKVAKATVRFSERAEVEPIWQDVKTGILRKVSVGYKIHKIEKVEDGEDKIPVYRATDWEPLEISLVPVPFDDAATVRTREEDASEMFACEVLDAERAADTNPKDKENEMLRMRFGQEVRDRAGEAGGSGGGTTAPVGKSAQEIENERQAAVDEATRVERERGETIRALVKKHGLEEAFGADLVSRKVKLEDARTAILDKLAERDEQSVTRGVVITHGDQSEIGTRRAAVEEALLTRFDSNRFKSTDRGSEFRNLSLLEIARDLLEMRGIKHRHFSKSEVAQRALSSSDFPLILANTASKTLRDGYILQPRTFLPFVRIVELPDYKEMSRVSFGEAPQLLEIKQGGPYTFGKVGEAAEKIKLAKHGRRLLITEETIVNDDLDAFTKIPSMFGSASARLESDLVYTKLLVANPKMADNVDLFHASHGNLPTAAAIGDAGLTAALKLLREQKGVDAQDYIGLEPGFLVCGTAKEVEAKKMLVNVSAIKSSEVNVFQGSMTPIVEPRVTGNKWFVIAKAGQIDTIEVGYLQGENGPVVTSKEGWESDGLEIKCKHVVTAKAIDYRGMIYNSGA
jgi:hypothetical protein